MPSRPIFAVIEAIWSLLGVCPAIKSRHNIKRIAATFMFAISRYAKIKCKQNRAQRNVSEQFIECLTNVSLRRKMMHNIYVLLVRHLKLILPSNNNNCVSLLIVCGNTQPPVVQHTFFLGCMDRLPKIIFWMARNVYKISFIII